MASNRLGGGGRVETIKRRFPHEPSSVRLARHDLLDWLDRAGCPMGAGRDTAALVVSELAANAVVHGSPLPGGAVEVAWRRNGLGLELEVTDAAGPQAPRVVDADSHALAGRGLLIVDSLAIWRADRNGQRRTVHAELDLDWP